jgi:lipopolysaccharide/colanic/teichoic acid biosynthesis glycosyltransferase
MTSLYFTDSDARSRQCPPAPPARGADNLLSRPARVYIAVKRAIDLVIALVLLLLTAPLIAVAMLLIKLTSPGPALYSQTRLGRYGRPFTLFKLRTMANDCESLTGPCWSLPGDSRVTRVGRWLRAIHVDELPQLWNVLRGDMSLIGPRPERPEFVPKLEHTVPHYGKRLQVRPGVTGLAQVQLPADSDLDSVLVKTAYDLHYVRRIGIFLDARIAWATCFKVVGMSYGRLRAVFRFPPREQIEADYRTLGA